jgi:hypothetical protein
LEKRLKIKNFWRVIVFGARERKALENAREKTS